MQSAVLPAKDHQYVICPWSRTRSEEIDDQTVVYTSEDQHDLVGAADAAMWNDKHMTMTRMERSGVFGKAHQFVYTGTHYQEEPRFERAKAREDGRRPPDEQSKCDNINRYVSEGRHLEFTGSG
jgi:hypothetical protein